jgi:hypothetical protein
MRSRTQALLIALAVAGILTLYYKRFLEAGQGTDFPHFYCAAKIVAAGLGHGLYDVSLQWQFQQRYTGRIGNFFVHPPFETLLYWPFALLPVRAAYLAWSFFNLLILALVTWLVNRSFGVPLSPNLILLLSLAFAPVSLNFIQGQDAVLLLLIFTATRIAIANDQGLAAGSLLALGLFKFQFALPAALILLAARKRGFAPSFTIVAAALVALSLAISGPSSFVAYPQLLLHLDKIPLSGVHPGNIPNLRGVLTILISAPQLRGVTLIGLSLLVFAIAIDGWRRAESTPSTTNLAFSNTVLAALAVSYQASPHDLTLLLIPISLTFPYLRDSSALSPRVRTFFLLTLSALFLPFLHVYALEAHRYALMAIPLILLLALNYFQIRRVRAAVG